MTPQARLLAAAVTATLLVTVVLKSPGQEPATSKQVKSCAFDRQNDPLNPTK